MTNVARVIPRQLPAFVVVAMLAACGGGGDEPTAVAQATANRAPAAQEAGPGALPSQPVSVDYHRSFGKVDKHGKSLVDLVYQKPQVHLFIKVQ